MKTLRNAAFEIVVEDDEIVIRQNDQVICVPLIQSESFCRLIAQATQQATLQEPDKFV